jgi:hypothetical protein
MGTQYAVRFICFNLHNGVNLELLPSPERFRENTDRRVLCHVSDGTCIKNNQFGSFMLNFCYL